MVALPFLCAVFYPFSSIDATNGPLLEKTIKLASIIELVCLSYSVAREVSLTNNVIFVIANS